NPAAATALPSIVLAGSIFPIRRQVIAVFAVTRFFRLFAEALGELLQRREDAETFGAVGKFHQGLIVTAISQEIECVVGEGVVGDWHWLLLRLDQRPQAANVLGIRNFPFRVL